MPAPELSIRGLSKSFGPNQVLCDVDLTISSGEFLGLMGPNGAGKSTLIKILDGIYPASRGDIILGGDRVESLSGRPDVGFIHQDLGLVEDLSILENLRLGDVPMRLCGPILNRRAEQDAAERALEHVGLDRPAYTLVEELSAGEKTLVAIARVLDRGASIVFVDEATSTLPPGEARRVIQSLLKMTREGATVIMVTHKLSEILDACQRVAVLLDGRLAADKPTEGLDRDALVRLLLQHEAARAEQEAGGDGHGMGEAGEVVLELREACGGRAGPVDLTLHAGEVIGVTGLTGSGLHDIAFLAHGSLHPSSGSVVAKKGLKRALVPPHRESQGGFPELTVRQNLTISALGRWRTKLRLLATRQEAADSADMIKRLSVRPPQTDIDFDVLSGGNKQKVIFGRALFREPQAYLLCEPTRGVDVATRSEIYRLIRELAEHGSAVLVVSSDLEDLLAVCDRVAAIQDGRLSELRPISAMGTEELEAII